MSDKKYRLITRADFDGVVSGGLLIEMDLISEVVFAEPRAIQEGLVHVDENDITTNLPYVEGVHLCFSHHAIEAERAKGKENCVIDADAASVAHIIYDHFGGEKQFPSIPERLLSAVDNAVSAQYTEEDILAPNPWTLLNFVLDPRTGLSRYENFEIDHEQLMKDMMVYVRHHPVEEILEIPDVQERVYLYLEHEEKFEMQMRENAKVHTKTVVVDLCEEDNIFAGNRFTIYAIFPACNISIMMSHTADKQKTIFAIGKSILDRSNKTDVGAILKEYGGGGHSAAGTCQVENDRAEEVLAELLNRVKG